MVAGDFPTHSDAIGRVRLEINRNPQLNVYGVAQAYGRVLCDIKREHAERSVLLPLSLTSETLLSRAHELPNWLVSDLTLQLQGYQGADVQALVVGSDQNSGYIYLVGADGRASCYNDVNFAAIGIGGWHARSQLMLSKYSVSHGLAGALVAVYRAKKSAEVAPGVGPHTDMFIVTKNGTEPVGQDAVAAVDLQYTTYKAARDSLVASGVADLMRYVTDIQGKPSTLNATPPPYPDPAPNPQSS